MGMYRICGKKMFQCLRLFISLCFLNYCEITVNFHAVRRNNTKRCSFPSPKKVPQSMLAASSMMEAEDLHNHNQPMNLAPVSPVLLTPVWRLDFNLQRFFLKAASSSKCWCCVLWENNNIPMGSVGRWASPCFSEILAGSHVDSSYPECTSSHLKE